MRSIWLFTFMFVFLLLACGGEPRSEATWETHTVAPEDAESTGGEAEAAPE